MLSCFLPQIRLVSSVFQGERHNQSWVKCMHSQHELSVSNTRKGIEAWPTSPKLRPIVMWALTYRCNLRCRYCYLFAKENTPSLERPEAPAHVVEAIAKSLTAEGHWRPHIVWLTGGEPTLHAQLPWLITKLEAAGIMTVVTTNGAFGREVASCLARSRPRGIMISLDLETPSDNNLIRGGGGRVLKTIRLLAHEKSSYTTLGVAVVISDRNRERLDEIAKFIEQCGGDYLSLNPMFHNNPRAAGLRVPPDSLCGTNILKQITKISERTSLLLPSIAYRELLSAYFAKQSPPIRDCPAAFEYVFIAPWGQVYPCSNEFWHSDPRMTDAPSAADTDFSAILTCLQKSIGAQRFSTHSTCYSTRCLGCWKLYYDSVFN
jgi:MoaA/NifB/PqqE/SkfB family radical SAM enzyme